MTDAPKTEEQRRTFAFARQVFVATIVVVAVLALAAFVWRILDVLVLFFAAILVAILLSALVDGVMRVTRLPRPVALLAVVGVIALALWGVGRGLAPRVGAELRELAETIPDALSAAHARVASTQLGRSVLEAAGGGQPLGVSAGDLFGRVRGAFSLTLGALGGLVLVIVAGVYLAWDPRRYLRGALHLLPKTTRPRAEHVMAEVTFTLRHWLLARLLAMIVVGLMTTVGLWILDVPLALALGFIAGAASFVPFIGFLLAGLLIVLFSLTQGTTTVLWVLALYLGVQWIEGNLVTPLLEFRAVRVPPALNLVAQLVMALLLGVVGVLFASPLFAAIFVVVRLLYVEDILGDTGPRDAEERRRAKQGALSRVLRRLIAWGRARAARG